MDRLSELRVAPETHPDAKFTADLKLQFCTRMSQIGTPATICQEIGIHHSTFRKHLDEDEVFRRQYELAQMLFKESIEAAIHTRAIQGTDEPVFFKGEEVGAKKVYSDRLLELLAKRHIPDYREKNNSVDINVNTGVLAITKSDTIDAEHEVVDPDSWADAYNNEPHDADAADGDHSGTD